MCTNPMGFRKKEDAKQYSMKQVLSRIGTERNKIMESGEELGLTGGEPTIHPDFLEIMKELRAMLPENTIAVTTNGRRFVYEKFTREVLKLNNLRFHIAVHSDNAKTHDAITCSPGSFDQTIKGLENIFKYRNKSHMIELRIILLKQNYKDLDNICRFLYQKFPEAERVCILFPEYEGRAEKNFKDVSVSFPEVKSIVEKAVENWGKKMKNLHLYHFPLCVVDSRYWKHVLRSIPPDHHEIFFLEKCDKCFYKRACLGVYKDYVNNFGSDHFTPILKAKKGIRVDWEDYHRPIK